MDEGLAGRQHLDVPVLVFNFKQKYEFYELDEHTSIAKIVYADKNGILKGGTSKLGEVPIGYGAHKKLAISLNSYPEGAADIDSLNPAGMAQMSDMIGNSLSHKFDESLKYLYAQYQVFTTG